MRRTYRTSKGTELPLLNLKGKEYLQVNYRLVWFREEHPNWRIRTEFISLGDEHALCKSEIIDEQGNSMATAHKYEDKRGFPDFREKAETGSIGRALALVGYGTQFCADELDEGERIVDAPLEPSQAPQGPAEAPRAPAAKPRSEDPGEYKCPFGKKYKGLKLKEVPTREWREYVAWLEENAEKKGFPLSEEASSLKASVDLYLEFLGEERT